MKENVITAVFENESEAYQACSEFRRNNSNMDYMISNAAVMKKNGDQLSVTDGFDTGRRSRTASFNGWIIGAIVGILFGFIGIFTFACIGCFIGYMIDRAQIKSDSELIQHEAKQLPENKTAMIMLADENNSEAIDRIFARFETTVQRVDAETVRNEVKAEKEEKNTAAQM